MARKADPRTPYLVRDGVSNGYRYAYVQKLVPAKESTDQMVRRKINLGTLSNDNVFTPNRTYRLMDIQERRKLIFPDEWDISQANMLDAGTQVVQHETVDSVDDDNKEEKPMESTEEDESIIHEESLEQEEKLQVSVKASNLCHSCKIYGSIWLLEQIAEQKGLFSDLLAVFNGDIGATNDVLTLAIYTIVENRSFNRLDRWLDTHKALSDHRFGSDYVTRFTQTITDDHQIGRAHV